MLAHVNLELHVSLFVKAKLNHRLFVPVEDFAFRYLKQNKNKNKASIKKNVDKMSNGCNLLKNEF